MATLKIQNWGFYPNILEDSSSIQKYVNILMLMQWLKKEVKKFQRPASQPLYWWFLVKRGLSLIGVSRNSKYLQASTFLPCLSLSLLRKWWVGYTGRVHGSGTRVGNTGREHGSGTWKSTYLSILELILILFFALI